MNYKKHLLVRSFWAIVLVCLPGCEILLMMEYNKATEIATFDLGVDQMVSKTIELPEGDADIMFVIKNHDCTLPLKGAIEIDIHDAIGKTIVNHNVKLSELTWPTLAIHPKDARDCVPIGYLYAKGALPLKFSVSDAENPVKVTFKITQTEYLGRPMSIWVVYSSLIPMGRILGSKH